jgi:hypothetical protein
MPDLQAAEFELIVQLCQRVLINESTSAEDTRRFLVARLGDQSPQAAVHLARLDARQMEELFRCVLARLRTGAQSALWAVK